MSGQIFISYRREEASAWARLVKHRLLERCSGNKIFIDVDTIKPGIDFVDAIEKAVSGCDVLIAIVCRDWLTSSDSRGKRRLENPEDPVRLEVATALKREIQVIPVLVDGARMPQYDDLPGDLKSFARRNAIEVSHSRFKEDSKRLISAVKQASGRPPMPSWTQWAGLSAGVVAVLVAAIFLYNGMHRIVPQPTRTPINSVTPTPSVSGYGALELPLSDLVAVHALHVIELGLDVAFVTPQQSQSMAVAMPPGALVREIESGGAAARSGLNVGDIIEAIGSQKIDTLDDMRKSFRELGPGKTQFTIRRSGVQKTILVDCPNC
jgi:hypothetical protein